MYVQVYVVTKSSTATTASNVAVHRCSVRMNGTGGIGSAFSSAKPVLTFVAWPKHKYAHSTLTHSHTVAQSKKKRNARVRVPPPHAVVSRNFHQFIDREMPAAHRRQPPQ